MSAIEMMMKCAHNDHHVNHFNLIFADYRKSPSEKKKKN